MTAHGPSRALTERDFQRQITDLAELCGWLWVHIRAGRTADSWRVPISGPLGLGFPDLLLVHPAQRRLLFVEVKTDSGRTTAAQNVVLNTLTSLEHYDYACKGGCSCGKAPDVRVELWRPTDWNLIEATLNVKASAA